MWRRDKIAKKQLKNRTKTKADSTVTKNVAK